MHFTLFASRLIRQNSSTLCCRNYPLFSFRSSLVRHEHIISINMKKYNKSGMFVHQIIFCIQFQSKFSFNRSCKDERGSFHNDSFSTDDEWCYFVYFSRIQINENEWKKRTHTAEEGEWKQVIIRRNVLYSFDEKPSASMRTLKSFLISFIYHHGFFFSTRFGWQLL